MKKLDIENFKKLKIKYYKIFEESLLELFTYGHMKDFSRVLYLRYSENPSNYNLFFKKELNEEFSFRFDDIKKLIKLIFNIIKKNPEMFLSDKYLKEVSENILKFNHIEYSLKNEYSLFKNSEFNIFKDKFIMYSHAFSNKKLENFSLVHILDYKHIFKKESKQFYLKDIFNSLYYHIDKKTVIPSRVSISFLKSQEDKIKSNSQYYINRMFDIIKHEKYKLKRKKFTDNVVNKRNFDQFFCSYINYNISLYRENETLIHLFKYTQKFNINIKNVRLDRVENNWSILGSLMNYIFCRDFFHVTNELNRKDYIINHTENSFIKQLEYLKPVSSTFIKKINPKKLSYKTKQIIQEYKFNINYLIDSKLFISLLDRFKGMKISEKLIRVFIKKFFFLNSYIQKENDKFKFNSFLIHDIFEVIFPEILIIVNKIENKNNLTNILRIIMNYNFDKTSLDHLYNLLSSIVYYIEEFQEELIITKPSSINSIIGEAKLKVEEKRIDLVKSKFNISERGFNYAANMDKLSQYLNLLSKVKIKEFKKESMVKYLPSIQRDSYSIMITAHNDELGLLGANVSGVCIRSDGYERVSQIKDSFNNLIITSTDSLIKLWGLLCRAENKSGEVVYILNNLQGSINKSMQPEKVLDDIFYILDDFCKNNNIKNIYYKDFYFNTLSLYREGDKAKSIDEDFEFVNITILDVSLKDKNFLSLY